VVHTTIATGVHPDKHGIHHNNPLQPFVKEEDQRWFWFREAVKAPTIYDAVRKEGIAPTMGRILGIDFGLGDGRALEEIVAE
jgi:hypothetical protein